MKEQSSREQLRWTIIYLNNAAQAIEQVQLALRNHVTRANLCLDPKYRVDDDGARKELAEAKQRLKELPELIQGYVEELEQMEEVTTK